MARTVKTSAKPGTYRQKGGGIIVVKKPEKEPVEHTVEERTTPRGKKLTTLTPVPKPKPAARKTAPKKKP